MNYLSLDTLNKIKEKYDKDILLKINMNNFNKIIDLLEFYKIDNIKDIVIYNLYLFLDDYNLVEERLIKLYTIYKEDLNKFINKNIKLLNK